MRASGRHEAALVDEHGERPSGERADPVHPVVRPDARGDGGPERPRRVHGRAGQDGTGDGVGAPGR